MKPTKIFSFKTVSPLFEMERDGIKPFTTRRSEPKDYRFRALARWRPSYNWGIQIINPATDERFTRMIDDIEQLFLFRDRRWKLILLGEKVTP